MRSRALQLVPAILLPLAAPGPVSSYEASRGPTEVVHWDPDKAYNGYTIVNPSRVDGVYLIDMSGEVVKHWPELTGLYLAEDGTLVGSMRGADFVEVDWDGNVLWEYTETRESYHPHHDDLRIYNPQLGHVAISSNRHFEIYIIDHDGTFVARDPEESQRLAASPAGDFLYRFGNPANYGQGDFPYYSDREWFILPYAGHRQIGGNHDIQWIREGLPGAGNLLLFNNGMSVPRSQRDRDAQSEVLVINPYLDGDGVDRGYYVNPPEAGYTHIPEVDATGRSPPVTRLISRQIVDAYRPLHAFVSYHGSGVQRLPNGNSLVSLARPGRLVEVAPDGEVVWEYVNPVTAEDGVVTTIVTSMHTNILGGWSPFRYAPEHPGLAGRDLSPKGPITEFHAPSDSGE